MSDFTELEFDDEQTEYWLEELPALLIELFDLPEDDRYTIHFLPEEELF